MILFVKTFLALDIFANKKLRKYFLWVALKTVSKFCWIFKSSESAPLFVFSSNYMDNIVFNFLEDPKAFSFCLLVTRLNLLLPLLRKYTHIKMQINLLLCNWFANKKATFFVRFLIFFLVNSLFFSFSFHYIVKLVFVKNMQYTVKFPSKC